PGRTRRSFPRGRRQATEARLRPLPLGTEPHGRDGRRLPGDRRRPEPRRGDRGDEALPGNLVQGRLRIHPEPVVRTPRGDSPQSRRVDAETEARFQDNLRKREVWGFQELSFFRSFTSGCSRESANESDTKPRDAVARRLAD